MEQKLAPETLYENLLRDEERREETGFVSDSSESQRQYRELVRITCSRALEGQGFRASYMAVADLRHGEVPTERHVLCWVTAAGVEKHIFFFLRMAFLLGLVGVPEEPDGGFG